MPYPNTYPWIYYENEALKGVEWSVLLWEALVFMQLAFNLSNRVTDTLESNTILIYSDEHMSLYTQNLGRMP